MRKQRHATDGIQAFIFRSYGFGLTLVKHRLDPMCLRALGKGFPERFWGDQDHVVVSVRDSSLCGILKILWI